MSKKIAHQKLERNALFDRKKVDKDARTVQLAFASEEPVERWFGWEILDCSPRSVDMARLNSGGPVLVGHNHDDQVGVVEKVSVDADRVCRATVRFSKSSRGQEILDDIADGIRKNVSVGYMITDVKKEGKREDLDVYRATSWSPHEISIVSCPADINVGVARQMEKGEKPMAEEKVPQVEENEEKTREQIAEEMRKAEQNRRSEIQEEHEKFIDKPFAQRIYNEMIADMDKGVRDYKDAVLDAMKEESERVPTVKPAKQTQSQIVTSIPTSLRYNKSSLHGFERFGAKAEEAAYRSGQWARAILFNDQRAARWCQDQGIRVMNELSGGSGGFTVPDELEMAITDLRNEYGVARQLCKVVPMGTLNTSIPIRSAGVTATFTPEQGSMTASDMTWKSANLVAKKLTAETRITKELAEDAIIDIAAIVADEHAWAFAQKEDECFINGDGTSTYGGITGLKTKFNADATLAGHVAHPGSANDADTFAEVQQDGIAKAMGALPSYARSGAVFLSSPTADSMIFEYIMATAGGNSTMTLGGAVVPSYLGKRRVVSESMPSDSTADYSASTILMYGDFSKACFFGDRSGIEMQVLRELYATSGQIAVIGTERFDINVDYAIGDATTAGSVVALVGN